MNRNLAAAPLLFLLVLAVTLPGRAAAPLDDASLPPLERTLILDLWGASLNDAARAVMSQTRVDIVFFRPDFPADKGSDNDVYLVTGRVSVRTVLECLGRRFGFRYRVADSGRVEVSKGYGWVPSDDFAVRFPRLDSLTPPGEADINKLLAGLREFVKPMALLGGDFTLALTRSPTPGNANSVKAEAVLPPVLADYFDRAVKCLSGDAGDYPPTPGRVRPPQMRDAYQAQFDWEGRLTRDIAVPREATLRANLKTLCAEAGIAVILGETPASGVGSPLAGLAAERASLGRITAELAERLGLNRRVFLATGALIFEPCTKEEWENDARSREFFWSGLGVAGYDARFASARPGGLAGAAARLRREVFPEVWRDPIMAIGYSDVTGRLAAIAPANVLAALAAKLDEMRRDGGNVPGRR